jgi:indolepyruvate ferredoxin oxidoreductase alpha subunit
MKHVGLNVAADPFFTQSYTGVNGGLVVICADDPFMHSSQNEQDNRHFARAAKVSMLEPATAQEAYDFAKLAFELSERFDTPVMLRVTTRLCHSDGVVEVGERQEPEAACALVKDPAKYVMVPARARARRQVIAERTKGLREAQAELGVNRIEPGDPAVGIVAAGIAYEYAKEVAPDASFLKLGVTWPLDEALLREFAATVSKLYVIEELDLYLTDSLRALGLSVETLPESLQQGELSPARVAAALRGEDAAPAAKSELPQRPPQLCPGCPHRGTFVALKKLGAYVNGDIGCYTLGSLPPLEALHTCVCMGGGIGQTHGASQACGEKQKAVAVIGDSTFVHSGITGLVNIAYNQSPATVVIVDNSTTAMTGGQDHPGTGRTLSGKPGGKLDLATLVRGCGIEHVVTVDPLDQGAVTAALREAMDLDAPAVVIAKSPCVLLSRERGPDHEVRDVKCVQCGACLRIGCPAIYTKPHESGRQQPVIDPSLCTGCTLCAQVCPKDAIEIAAGGEM